MTNTLQHTPLTAKRLKSMSKEQAPHRKVHEEMAKFEKTMEELRLLKSVSQDQKNYRKMIRVKRYD
jgi:hypothetical protein